MPEEFGPYLVYEQIGAGGMATVHRAETRGVAGFRKEVALKRMLPSIASDAKFVQSFVREARLASHLRHANVAQTYDLGKVDDTYFIAMELVTGHNLREILAHCSGACGPMPLPVVLNVLNQICEALDYAHDLCDETGQPLGIIHRDVSPANIIVSEGGVVKLIDFGIAKASAAGMQTQSGAIKGKFGYMAPEYIAGSIDARADLFALGVVGYELLTNRPLFKGKDDMETLSMVKSLPILPPSHVRPEVPPEIDSIVMTALERDPSRRWQRANALRTALAGEAKRLGLAVLNNAVVEWMQWAFQQRGSADAIEAPSIELSGTVDLARPSAPQLAKLTRQDMAPPPPLRPSPPQLPPQPQLPPPGTRRPDEPTIGGVLESLEHDSATTVPRASALRHPTKPSGSGHRILFALLILLVAAGTAAVVYFALPYFT